MELEEKTKKIILDGKNGKMQVIIVCENLTKEEARRMFPHRPLNKYSESRFGGNNLADDFALLLNGCAKRCPICQAPTKKNI